MTEHTISDFKIGDRAEFTKTVSESDIYGFAGITGDFNPMHVNEAYAAESIFGGRIAHGILTAGLISTVLGMKLPGPGALYVSQDLRFLKPVMIGDTLTAYAEVTEINQNRNRLTLATGALNQRGEQVAAGRSILSPSIKSNEEKR